MQFRWVMPLEATCTFQVLFTFHMWNEWQKYLSFSHYFLLHESSFTFQYIPITKLLSQKYTVMNTIPNFDVESKRRIFILDYFISHSCDCHSYWDNISCFNGKHWKYILNIYMCTKLMGRGIYYMKVLCPLILDSYTSLQVKVTRLSHHTPTISVVPQ